MKESMKKTFLLLSLIILLQLMLMGCNQAPIETNYTNQTTIEEIIENELSSLTESTVLVNKFKVEFDNAKTYTIWLYAEQNPSQLEIEQFGTQLAIALTNKMPEFYYNFYVFPKDSKKEPGDSLPFDAYINFVWRDNRIAFPVE